MVSGHSSPLSVLFEVAGALADPRLAEDVLEAAQDPRIRALARRPR